MSIRIHTTGIAAILPGIIPPVLIGAAALVAGEMLPLLGGPVIAILAGLCAGQVFGIRKEARPGNTFASRTILQASIVLLGAGMSLGEVARIGWEGFPVMCGTLAVCLISGIILIRLLQVEREAGILVTYGTAICGASAIATMSAVTGAAGPAVAVSVTVIVLYNFLGALFFPTLGHMLGLSQEAFGLWAGTAINDTSSVLAAATVYGAAAAAYAVVVKLTRTLALVPLAIFQSWIQKRGEPAGGRGQDPWYRLVPPFLIWFLVAAALQSAGLIPDPFDGPVRFLARAGITTAMAAVGLGSSLGEVRSAGWRPVLLGGILWILVSGSSLLFQYLIGRI